MILATGSALQGWLVIGGGFLLLILSEAQKELRAPQRPQTPRVDHEEERWLEEQYQAQKARKQNVHRVGGQRVYGRMVNPADFEEPLDSWDEEPF